MEMNRLDLINNQKSWVKGPDTKILEPNSLTKEMDNPPPKIRTRESLKNIEKIRLSGTNKSSSKLSLKTRIN